MIECVVRLARRTAVTRFKHQVGSNPATLTMKKCKLCKEPLKGEMLFYPVICLSCVIDYHCKGDIFKLKKYEKKSK